MGSRVLGVGGNTGVMLVIGHRGASAAAAENSVQAFVLADAMGADGVELDVRLAPDGRLMVKHDPLPADPALLDAYPQLDEVLGGCRNMLVNVEIKNSAGDPEHDATLAVVEPTIAEMRVHGPLNRWIISSFDWDTIERCRAVAPDIATAFLVMAATDEVIEQTAVGGHAAIHPHAPTITAATVERCHDVGLAVNTWTCNDPDRIRELAAFGVDGVCTDVPDVALEALGRRIGLSTTAWGRPA
jgi:glycerophosphoryl diester phosphodiesterase